MKVVYNSCFGGFSLSDEAVRRYAELKGMKLYPEKDERFGFVTYWKVPADARPVVLVGDAWNTATAEQRIASNRFYSDNTISCRDLERDDPALVRVVEELGERANGQCAQLAVEDVPAGSLWRIDEYDGNESVATQDSYEWKVASS